MQAAFGFADIPRKSVIAPEEPPSGARCDAPAPISTQRPRSKSDAERKGIHSRRLYRWKHRHPSRHRRKVISDCFNGAYRKANASAQRPLEMASPRRGGPSETHPADLRLACKPFFLVPHLLAGQGASRSGNLSQGGPVLIGVQGVRPVNGYAAPAFSRSANQRENLAAALRTG